MESPHNLQKHTHTHTHTHTNVGVCVSWYSLRYGNHKDIVTPVNFDLVETLFGPYEETSL